MRTMSNDNPTIERTENGTIRILFSRQTRLEKLWIFPLLLISVLVIIEIKVFNTAYMFLLLLVSIILITSYYIYKERRMDNLLKQLMLDSVVKKDAETAGLNIIRSRVHYETKGTYGIITGGSFLVLLDNGEVWSYPLIDCKSEDEDKGVYEYDSQYRITDNSEYIDLLRGNRISRILNKLKISDDLRLKLLLFSIFVFGFAVCALLLWLIYILKFWSVALVLGTIGLSYLYEIIKNKLKEDVSRKIERALLFPTNALVFLTRLSYPFITISLAYIFIFLFSFGVLTIALKSTELIGLFTLKMDTIVFLVISLGSILCCNGSYTDTVLRLSPIRNWGNHKYEKYREELARYVVQPANVVFFLYLVYFAFLSVSGFMLIEYDRYLISEGIDYAILKAFLVYIAYTNVRAKWSAVDIDEKTLLEKTIKMFTY